MQLLLGCDTEPECIESLKDPSKEQNNEKTKKKILSLIQRWFPLPQCPEAAFLASGTYCVNPRLRPWQKK